MITKHNNGRIEHIWTFTDDAGAALNIASSQFACLIRKRGGVAITQNFTLSKTGTAGELRAVLSHTDAAALSGVYEIEILEKDASGFIYYFHTETMEVKSGFLAAASAAWQ